MTETVEPTGAELAERDEERVPLPVMGREEMFRTFKIAEGLAKSGLFKDARQATQAFAKIVAGRDLGLTPFESMAGLHVIEGKIEAGADLHATRVRNREGYDYRIAWIKGEPEERDSWEAVYAEDDEATDLREIVGCAIEFTVDGEMRGVSRFTYADAQHAGLFEKDKTPWRRYPRNMYFARAMTNGVAWFVPEVMGGMRVYAPGEIVPEEGVTSGENGEQPTPSDTSAAIAAFAPSAETAGAIVAVFQRAKELGHASLSHYPTVELALKGQPVDKVWAWVNAAKQELDEYEAKQQETRDTLSADEPVIEDADVVTPESLEAEATGLLDEADTAEGEGKTDLAETLRTEASILKAQADALREPTLGTE